MRHVLITGATGALGSEVALKFAADRDTRVTVLLRAESDEHLSHRREQLFKYLRSAAPELELESRFDAIRGDVSEERFGLDSQAASALSENVTHVVHSAGNVKLNQPMDKARDTAVGSARTVVEFVERCQQAGRFRKLEFVSTVGVAGRRSGLIPEERFPGPRDSSEFHNTYEAAKWEAERYLWEQIDAGLPATVHRPSMIVGDSATGRIIHFQVFYFLTDFLTGRRTAGLVPRTRGAVLDIIPVDYVASAIHLASREEQGVGEVWHLCSGPERSWSLDRLIDQLRELRMAHGESLPTLRPVPRQVFRSLVNAGRFVTSSRTRRFLKGLPFLLDYLDEQQLFENARTDNFLRRRDLTIPAVDSYLETVMLPFWHRQQRGSATR